MKYINNFNELKALIKSEHTFDVRVLLNSGVYSRKTVYEDLGCFNYIDESSVEFNSEKDAKAYWNDYFKKYKIIFDGYN